MILLKLKIRSMSGKDENELLIAANLDRSILPFLQTLQGRIRELTGVEEN